MTPEAPGPPIPGIPSEVTFFYDKASNFSTSPVDGAVGGPVPSGNIYLAFFLERGGIGTTATHRVAPDGTVQEQIRTDLTPHVVRELQTAIVMNLNSARAIHGLLGGFIKQVEGISAAINAQQQR